MVDLERKLDQFAQLNAATEVVIFERTTFLVISKSSSQNADLSTLTEERRKEIKMEEEGFPPSDTKDSRAITPVDESGLYPGRFGKISQLIKGLRLACSYVSCLACLSFAMLILPFVLSENCNHNSRPSSCGQLRTRRIWTS